MRTPRAPAPSASAVDEVHVWLGQLDLGADTLNRFRDTLSIDERARADRYHFERDRRRFIAARGMLRDVLARYLRSEPPSVRFEYTAHGKPFLSVEATRGLRFNLAHAQGIAMLAVARDREVGVDVEQLRADLPFEIADRFFSASERAELDAVPPHLRAVAFLNCWTRKEAYIKGRGEGLSLPLESFDVSLRPGDPARLLDVRSARDEVDRWSLRALPAPPDYIAAIAVEGQGWRLSCFQWSADHLA